MDDFITKKLKYNTIKKTIHYDASMLGTVDSLHTKTMDEFNKQHVYMQKQQQKINKLKKELNELENKSPHTYTSTDISKKANIKEKIETYEDELEKNNLAIEQHTYFDNNINILLKYYSQYNKLTATTSNNENINNIHTSLTKTNTLLDVFNKQPFDANDNLLDEYLKCTQNKHKRKRNIPIQKCETCNIEKILQVSDGHMVCTECGHSDQIIVDMEKINFKDPFYENKNTGYKRMNHFSELMNQFQAKESTDIEQSIYNYIIVEIKKQKIINPKLLNKKKMRSILKKLELNHYFEHIPFIINRLTGLTPPTITRETEERLKSMFKEIQVPFAMFRPKQRKNFLNYNYVFHKFFELLNMDQFLPHFPLLKSADKLREQDELWDKICKYLKWEYIPST